MSDSKISIDQPVELDLRGFHRRLPRAAIAWHISRLSEDGTLAIIVDSDVDNESVIEALRFCGAEIVSDDVRDDGRWLNVHKGNAHSITLELDMRGRRCPIPVIEARRKLQTMSSGEVLKLFTDCTSAPAEINAWAESSAGVAFLGEWSKGPDHYFLLESR